MIVKIDVRSFNVWIIQYDLRAQTYSIRSWLEVYDHFAETLWSLDWRYMICYITWTLYFEAVRSFRWIYAITYTLLKSKTRAAHHQHQNPKNITTTRTDRRAHRVVRGFLALLSYSFILYELPRLQLSDFVLVKTDSNWNNYLNSRQSCE